MPELKGGTIGKREEIKEEARKKYEEAKEKEDIDSMRKFSQQLARLTPEIKEESKKLLEAMGIQIVQAPSEAEAQASYMTKKGKAFTTASQDYDALLFQTPRLLQNLTLARKRKTVSGYVEIFPQLIELEKVLNFLGINHEQLICLGILAGTDYNPGGIRGIGQKRALEIVKRYKYPVKIFQSFEQELNFDWKDIFELFKNPRIKDIEVKFPKPDYDKVKKILMKRDFSEMRIDSGIDKLNQAKEKQKQKTLF